MRHGFKHIPLPNPPIGQEVESVLGIPIEFSQYHEGIADARGFWPKKKIVVGPRFVNLDQRVRQAVLIHEARHCLSLHLEQRCLLLALLLLPLLLLPMQILVVLALVGALYALAWFVGVWHETDADAFAARHGYGKELLSFLKQTYRPPPDTFYPNFEKRCNKLARLIKEKANVESI